MPLRRTPLFDWHARHGARFAPFAGWETPLQFSGILDEHRAVRERAGLFDVSHMGELRVRGREAAAFLDELVTNQPSSLRPGEALYTPMCREDGGILDDLVVYRLGPDDFLLVVNAANTESDLAWARDRARGFPSVAVDDETEAWALLALQGPEAEAVLRPLVDFDPGVLGRFRLREGVRLAGAEGAVVARTGYTGEDGFELFVPWEAAEAVWETLLAAGEPRGLRPAGLGARDTLRLEAALPLYGHELTTDVNPLEVRLLPFVRFEKPSFVGREALLRVRERGPARRLVGLVLREPGVAREGYAVFRGGREVGRVTSGTLAPTLGESVALALVGGGAAPGERLSVDIRGRRRAAEVVKLPFYRRAACRPAIGGAS
ncbi:MAG: glycine cleavage system aminomethyltransferase GcvT [Clostridia bacterium]|nr:glycine cleavage system aminomethyltransferase GcvT [Clostridia bacterium]